MYMPSDRGLRTSKMGVGILESVQEEEGSIDDLRRCVSHMRERQKSQAKLLLLRKHVIRDQNRKISLLEKRQKSHLSAIQAQLLIFQSSLKTAQKEFETVVRHKDETLRQQHQLICALSLALVKRGGHEDLKNILPGIQISTSNLDETLKKDSRSDQDSLKRLGKKNVQIISSSKDPDSLNDSDSAIMMEEAYDSLIVIPVGKGEAKVMRSVSDALEIVSRSTSLTHTKGIAPLTSVPKRSHGSLSTTPSCSSEESDESPPSTMTKAPSNILRTAPDGEENAEGSSLNCSFNSVLSSSLLAAPSPPDSISSQSPSVTPLASPSPTQRTISSNTSSSREASNSTTGSSHDSSYDSDATLSDGYSDDEEATTLQEHSSDTAIDKKHLKGSYEKLSDLGLSFYKKKPEEETIQVTYNRVMSNHRSVTKPKDVKYKRINKAKSRSLEELRGKLKFFDGKHSISIDLGQSEA